MKFEEYEGESGSYDLIYSASAFHWIPEEIGYPKVFALLKKGGVFARFANHPYKDKGREELWDEIQKLYAIYMPGVPADKEYAEEDEKNRADIARKYGFTETSHALSPYATFTAEEYVTLLNTYSDHTVLSEETKEFLKN